ncbi:MAG: putative immunity protein [Planctomycetota bacterium]
MTGVSDLFSRAPIGLEAKEWGRRYADDLGHAWAECPRGDWALWIAAIMELDPRVVTQAALDCARFALSLLPEADDEERLRPVLTLADRWVAGEVEAEALRDAAREVLAIYNEGKGGAGTEHLLAGYATSAVAAAVLVPTYRSTFGLAAAAAAAGLAAAQVAGPHDETALLDAHECCARLVRKRIPFEALVGTRGFSIYARSASPR